MYSIYSSLISCSWTSFLSEDLVLYTIHSSVAVAVHHQKSLVTKTGRRACIHIGPGETPPTHPTAPCTPGRTPSHTRPSGQRIQDIPRQISGTARSAHDTALPSGSTACVRRTPALKQCAKSIRTRKVRTRVSNHFLHFKEKNGTVPCTKR